jgi:hypothetical protein
MAGEVVNLNFKTTNKHCSMLKISCFKSATLHSQTVIAHAACYLGLLLKETYSNNFRKFEIKTMITDNQIRHQIFRRVSRIPKEKLRELSDFLSKLEDNFGKKQKVLSFAGAWNDIDDDVFSELTDKLIDNRSKNRKRIDE